MKLKIIKNNESGLTIIELLIASSISLLLMAGLITFSGVLFSSQRKTTNKLESLHQNRRAMDKAFEEIRLASASSIILSGDSKIEYEITDIDNNTTKRSIFFDKTSKYLYTSYPKTTKLVDKPLYDFAIHKTSGPDYYNYHIIIYFTADSMMKLDIKPLNQ